MTGRIVAKGYMYYMILNLKDESGRYKQKWIRTGLSTRLDGNRERAEGMLYERLNGISFASEQQRADIEFKVMVKQRLRTKKLTVQASTYESYKIIVEAHILPFFIESSVAVNDVSPNDLQNYYFEKLDAGLSPNTLIKHSTVLNGCFHYALQRDLIMFNPMDKVILPTKEEVPTDFFTENEMLAILDKVRGTPIETAVYIAVYTGFRRGEVLGVRWKRSIDWKLNTITMNHTVVRCGSTVSYKYGGKNQASIRTVSLPMPLRAYLEQLYIDQKNQKATFGDGYEDNDYVCKRADGHLLEPNYVTRYFRKFLKQHNLPPYHFHTLRHSAATFLLSQGHSLLEIMLQLGHKKQESSARYTHLQSSALVGMAKSFDSLAL